MSGYTPDTESVRTAYRGGWAEDSVPGRNANGEFDRWLASHDIELAQLLGWAPLGTYVGSVEQLEFAGEGPDGLPMWERPRAYVNTVIERHMVRVAHRVMDVFENADEDAMAEDVRAEVFKAIGLTKAFGAEPEHA